MRNECRWPHARRTGVLLLAAVTLLAIDFCAPVRADSEADEMSAVWELAGHPIASDRDLAYVNALARNYQTSGLPDGRSVRSGGTRRILQSIEEFTARPSPAGESVRIVSFKESDDPALIRLRTGVGLPPPKGGAVVRTYRTIDEMPEAIRALFGRQAAGITYLSRFIAMWIAGRSDEEVQDILSHELVHAYVMATMGQDSLRLPDWFHEGAALYVSGGKTQYLSHSDYGSTRVSWSPRKYNEWRRVFQYLDASLGQEEVDYFIRRCVQERQVLPAMRETTGAEHYGELLQRANAWAFRQQVMQIAAFVIPVAVLLLAWRARARWLSEEMLGEDEM